MVFTLPPLPYEMNALEPHISRETLDYHYGKHHQTYVNNLNKLTEGTKFADASLEHIIKHANGGIFNNAAQIWNHTFYWHSLNPKGGGEPTGEIASLINKNFGSFETFKQAFTQSAVTLFGSGWTWLVKKHDSTLAIVNTSNADNPMLNGDTPLLTCDVWEHAYYIDVRNARAKYLENFWQIVNWDFANAGLAKKG
jgi:superoxide dismutase, Fe-Mn family